MTGPIDIRPDHLRIVQNVLRTHLPSDTKAWVFGSRAAWETKDSSDLDLAIEGKKPFEFKVIYSLQNDFEDSDLPYTVDIVDINRISANFKQIIETQKTPLPIPKDHQYLESTQRDQSKPKSENLTSVQIAAVADQAINFSAEQKKIVLALVKRHLPNSAVWVCGPHVEWTERRQSDPALILFMTSTQSDQVKSLRKAFEKCNLPFQVELFEWDEVPESFRQHIQQEFVASFTKKQHSVQDWKEVKLGDCIAINNSTYSPKENWPFINYLETGKITKNCVAGYKTLVLGKDKIPNCARRKVQSGDIVYSMVHPNKKHFGLLKDIPDNLLASSGFCVVRGKAGVAETSFIYLFLIQEHVIDQLQAIAEQSTSEYPSVRPIDIQRLKFNLPPLKMQRAIANFLATLDDKIELNRRMNETLQTMIQALFNSWFVDFEPVRSKMKSRDYELPEHIAELFPDKLVDSEVGEIPAGWEVSEIGKEVDVVCGATPSTKEPACWDGGSLNWATPEDLSEMKSLVLLETKRKITSLGLEKIGSGLLPAGTVLLSARAPIDDLCITEEPTAVNQGLIAMICKKRLNNLYVFFWCRENLERIRSLSGDSTFEKISEKAFRPVQIIVPSEQILTAYGDIVRPLFDQIVENKTESALLAQTRDLLLPKLISGEIVLDEAQSFEDMPSSEEGSLSAK